MIRSLRYRLLIGASLSAVVVLSLLGISLYAAMRHALMNDFENSLRAEARLLAGMIEQNNNGLTFEFDPEQAPQFVSGKHGHFFQIWRDDGTVLARSLSLGRHDLPKITEKSDAAVDVGLPDERSGLAVIVGFTPKEEEHENGKSTITARRLQIMVAAVPIDAFRTLRLLGWLLVILCAAAVAIMGAVLLRVVSHGVRPVTQLAGKIDSLKETDLAHHLPRDGVPDELLPVVDKLNGLLARLEGAFIREKSFTADVAHELRTPLTGLRMTLEVCRSQPREASVYEAALDECRGITDRMEAMVESLLLLARSDAGQIKVERQPVDLAEVIRQSWSLYQYRAERRNIPTTFDLPESCIAQTDPAKVPIVLHNILDNAVSYTDDGGRIRIAATQEGQGAVITIANTGSLISPEDAPRLFERFWRGDTARTDAGVHCGLGLSLSQRLMTLLDGTISIETIKGGEFIVRLRFS